MKSRCAMLCGLLALAGCPPSMSQDVAQPELVPTPSETSATTRPSPRASGKENPGNNTASVNSKSDTSVRVSDPVRPAPIYLTERELRLIADRLRGRPELSEKLREALNVEDCLSRSLRLPVGVHVAWPLPGYGPAFRPGSHGQHFRRLLGDAQTVRDLALAWTVESSPAELADGPLAAVVRRKITGHLTIEILLALTGPYGISPVVVDRASALELGLVVPNLYMAADLMWSHPGWRRPDGRDGRVQLCEWAGQLADSLAMRVPSLRGRAAAWGHHLWVASLLMAGRTGGLTGRVGDRDSRLRTDLERALADPGVFGLAAQVAREVTPLGQVSVEQWTPDGAGRATLALAGWLLTLDVVRRHRPELLALASSDKSAGPLVSTHATIRRALEYQFPRLQAETATAGELPDRPIVPPGSLLEGRHPQLAWRPLVWRVYNPAVWPTPTRESPTGTGTAKSAVDVSPTSPDAASRTVSLPLPAEAELYIGPVPGADDPPGTPRPMLPVFGVLAWLLPHLGE